MALKGLKRRASSTSNLHPEKKSKGFPLNSFLNSLQQPECLTSLKSFVNLSKTCETDGDDIIKEYLESDAGLEEILKCVNVNDKKNLALATTAFSAVRIIIMRILSNLPQFYVKAEVGCRYLLRAFLPIINTMLSLNSNAHQRKIVLRLLTAVVTVSSELAHEVAVQVTLSPPVLELLVKHSQASEGKHSVRSCFIHYLLSFFVSGSDFTIRLLLDKKGYINSIIPGLMYDSADLVVLVLATLRSKVLENPSVSKTKKLRTFSVPVIRSLIGLYEWKGPKKWKGDTDIPVQQADEQEDKAVVCESVHEFLIVLCTSKKHGIAFIDKTLGTSGNKQNPVLYGVIQGLDQPWDNAFTSELVVKILQLCPELVKSTLANTESFLPPRPSVKWEKTISFVEKVVTSVEPEHLKSFAESVRKNADDNRLLSLVLSLTVPAVPLRVVGEAGVTHPHLAVRHRTVSLLVTLLLRLKHYQMKLLHWGVNLSADALSAYLTKHLPDAQLIHQTWGKQDESLVGENDNYDGPPAPDAGDYECALLQLLLLYQQMCPQLVDIAVMTQWIRTLLPNLLELEPNKDFPLMLARATFISLSTDSSILMPDSEIFRKVSLALFSLVGRGSKPAKQALCALLEASGQLEGAQRELPIWLHSYTTMSPDSQQEVSLFIVDTIQDLAQDSASYLEILQGAEEGASTSQTDALHHVPSGSFQELLDAFFKFLLNLHSEDSATRLSVLLLRHNPNFLSSFRKTAMKKMDILQNAALVFSLLTCSSQVQDEMSKDDEFLRKLYELHGPEIQKSIRKPSKAKLWMHTNVPGIALVLDKCFDHETYSKILPAVTENITQMTVVDQFYLNLIKAVCFSAWKNQNENTEHLLTFVKMLLPLITRVSEEGKISATDLLVLPELLNNCADNLNSLNELRDLKGTQPWFNFCRVCLKFGLQNENEYHSVLLSLLTRFVSGVYEENSNSSEAVTLFQMTVSHSKFLNVFLGKTQAKGNLAKLLLTLATRAPSVMLPEHVPVLLGAYGATLSSTDQLIMQLLHKYESSGVTLERCQPYLWGEAAVNHYSVRVQGSSSLWQQPHANQVLDMLDSAVLQTTISKFPYERDVQVLSNMNINDPNIYDPAFILPLLSKLLAPESPVRPQKVIHSDALALVLAALASESNATRAAAWHVIGQFYTHLEASNFGKERHLWLHLLDVIRCGAADIVTLEKNSTEVVTPKLSCIVSTFLSRTSLLISQPLHPLYQPLHNFILAKPSLYLLTIPEFLPLFHSSDLDHSIHRHWILEVIRDGLKSPQDIELCFRCVLFKLLLDYYFSVLADPETKVLIVSVLESALKVPGAAKLLINGYSVVVWLKAAIDHLTSNEISLARALFGAVAALPVTTPSLPTLLINFLTHLPATVLDLHKYLEVLMSIKVNLLSREHVNSLLNKAEEILNNVDDCKMLLQYEGKFYIQEDIKNIQQEELKTKLLLKNILLTWLNSSDK